MITKADLKDGARFTHKKLGKRVCVLSYLPNVKRWILTTADGLRFADGWSDFDGPTIKPEDCFPFPWKTFKKIDPLSEWMKNLKDGDRFTVNEDGEYTLCYIPAVKRWGIWSITGSFMEEIYSENPQELINNFADLSLDHFAPLS